MIRPSKIIKYGSEAAVQKAVIDYLRYQYPDALYCATAGGMKASYKQAARMKLTGYVKGVPDLQIFEPRGGFHGLMIEIKKDKTSYPTTEQKEWIKKLNERGYSAHVCKGVDEAIGVINSYFTRD
jgi:hypothetical protein